jgi:hypothetical protein
LLATVQAIADLAGEPIAAVFVDTVSRVLPGAEENQQRDMTIFIAACDAVRQQFKATVIGIHHTARAGNMRGSTVIPAAGDFIIEVRREPGAPIGSIFAAKIKAAQDGWEQFFKVTEVQLGDVGLHTSLVIDACEPVKKENAAGWPERDICRQILAAIDEQWGRGEPWCYAVNSPRCAVTNIMKRWRLKREVAKDIVDTWQANGVINEEVHSAKAKVKGYRKVFDI